MKKEKEMEKRENLRKWVVLALGACSFVLLRRKEDSANEKK